MLKSNLSPAHEEGVNAVNGKARFFLAVMLLLLLLGVLTSGRNLSPERAWVPYSDFKALLRGGALEEVVIGKRTITAELREGTFPSGLVPSSTLETIRAQGGEFATPALDDPDLIRELETAKIAYRGQLEGGAFVGLVGWLFPLGLMLLFLSFISRRTAGNGGGGVPGTMGKSRARIAVQTDVDISFEDVAGVDEAKEELQEIITFLKDPGRFTRLGGKMPKGMLLVGPPGTGKTLLAKAVAGEANVPFFSISGSEFVEVYVGVGAARVRDLFEQAKTMGSCIIFIDELDALGKIRGVGQSGGNEEREQTLNQLLVEMDGFDSSTGIIILAATNRPEVLDPALLRPGRFDRHVVVDRPDIVGRKAILQTHARNVKLADDVDLQLVAARTPGFVGADLANVVNEAALLAARRDHTQVTLADFEEAIDRVTTGLQKKSRHISEKEKKIIAYHESGHAIVAHFSRGAEPVHKISIIPTGIGALGYTQQMPEEDRYLLRESELASRIRVLLGGRAAELLIFGEVTTGAQNDLIRATDIANRMVREYGMSSLGLTTFREDPGPQFLGAAPPDRNRSVGPETAQALDLEVQQIIDTRFQEALDILKEHPDILASVAESLLEHEVVERGEFLRLVLQKKLPPSRVSRWL